MAERIYLDWFRERLELSRPIEPKDASALLRWLEELRLMTRFHSELVDLGEVRGWDRDAGGNIGHSSGQFFTIKGARTNAGTAREVVSWDQPIYTQREGGILAMVARETPGRGVEFLLQAKGEPGNIGLLQFSPTVQATGSNMKRAHGGKSPPLLEVLTAPSGVRIVYRAQHNEEGGRFWQKSNDNVVAFLDDESIINSDLTMFRWASLSQIKELFLLDNVVNPFVKTILAPL